MKKYITGRKYDFIVKCAKVKFSYCFYIEAKHRASFSHSYINNINCVLSEFNIGVNDKKVAESQWVLPKKEAGKYFKKADNFLNDSDFRKYVERQLDCDRELGDWNKSMIDPE